LVALKSGHGVAVCKDLPTRVRQGKEQP